MVWWVVVARSRAASWAMRPNAAVWTPRLAFSSSSPPSTDTASKQEGTGSGARKGRAQDTRVNPLDRYEVGQHSTPAQLLHFEKRTRFYDDSVAPSWERGHQRELRSVIREEEARHALLVGTEDESPSRKKLRRKRTPLPMNFLRRETLMHYTDRGTGKLLRRRKTGLSPKEHRDMSKLVKRARAMGILKYKPDTETFLKYLVEQLEHDSDPNNKVSWAASQRGRGRGGRGGGRGRGGVFRGAGHRGAAAPAAEATSG